MEIDFSSLQGTFNNMALKLGLILFAPFLISVIIGLILTTIKFPKRVATLISTVIFLFLAYKIALIVLG